MRNTALMVMPIFPLSKFTLLFPTTPSLLRSFFSQTALWEMLQFLVSLRPSKRRIHRAVLASGTSWGRELGCRLRSVRLCTEAHIQVRLLRGACCLGSAGPSSLRSPPRCLSARTQPVLT